MTCPQAVPPRTAILFLTHLFDQDALAALRAIELCAGAGDVHVLADATSAVPQLRTRLHCFDFSQLRQRYPGAMGNRLVPGNGHLPLLSFYGAHPEYDYYWIVEYDVRFTGSWETFFNEFSNNTADLLGVHLRRFAEEPEWFWWKTLKTPAGAADHASIRAFMPLYRISRTAVSLLSKYTGNGWSGHHECLVPSLLAHHGLRLEDIGGDGSSTPPERRGRFYTTFAFRGHLRHLGSMRHRPPLIAWGGRRNFLYHPVKNGTASRPLAAVNALLCVAYCLKHMLSAHGHIFIRDLLHYARLLLTRRP